MTATMEIAEDTQTLISQAKTGSHAAFAELVRIFQARIRLFLARHLFGADAVDDLAQEVFLAAFRQLEQYNASAPFESWLMGIARNKALQFLRGESRRRAREHRVIESAMSQWQSDSLLDSLETAEDQQRYIDALRGCLEQLPKNSRSVIDKFYFQNKTTEAIATSLNKNNGAIRMTLLRIRRALEKCVTEKRERLEFQS